MLGMRDASEEALNEPSGLLARRVDIGGLLRGGVPPVEYLEGLFARRMVYAKGVTAFTGHPKSMKTTLVSRLALDAMAAGRYVVYLDWENGDEEVARRFLDLGAPADLLSERLVYLPFPGAPNWAEIGGIWDEFPDAVGIWDSTRGILRSLGLNEDKAAEVGQFLDPLVEFSLTRSVPSLLIDHVIKSATENTGYARGSGDKLAAVQAQWYVKCPTEITETEPGEIEVIRWAARSGRLNRRFRFLVGDGEGNLTFQRLDADQSPEAKLERSIIEFLKAGQPEAFSLNQITAGVTGTAATTRETVKALAEAPDRPVELHEGRYRYVANLDNEGQASGASLAF